EAGHVRALLVAREVDEAVEPREEELVADPHDLLDTGDADPREADRDARRARLDVVAGAERRRDDRGRSAPLHRGLAYRGRPGAPKWREPRSRACVRTVSRSCIRAADFGITP